MVMELFVPYFMEWKEKCVLRQLDFVQSRVRMAKCRRNVEDGIWNSGMIEIANVKISYYFVILCYILGILERNKTVSKASV